MLAHHPLTGAPIRIITTENSLWKDAKTLAFTEDSSPSPWERISTDLSSGAELLLILHQVSLTQMKEASDACKILFVSREVVQEVGIEGLKSAQIFNLVCLEEMAQIYPHLGGAWDGSVEDAVILAAGLLRYRCVSGVANLSERALRLSIQLRSPPERLWWVTQYYKPSKAKRAREIDRCLQKNMESRLIDRIVLLNEKEENLGAFKTSSKVQEKVIGHRITYADVMRQAAEFPEDVIVVFANADICIDDESWRQLWQINLHDRLLALLRWDVEAGIEPKLFGPRPDSQDTWVVRAEDVHERGAVMWSDAFAIPFGKAGCDNAIALEFLKQRFRVSNPALSLKTWHHHSSAVRAYNPQDVVERPAFLYIQPSGLHDLQPVLQLPAGPLHLSNCFQTEGGLVFDSQKMYIGSDGEAQRIWSQAQIHAMTPTVACDVGLISPFTQDAMKTRENYILGVLSRVLRLREAAGGKGEFFCPEKKEVVDSLQMFQFQGGRVPLVKWEPNMMMWCREAWAFPVGAAEKLSKEDIAALRKYVRGWTAEVARVENSIHQPSDSSTNLPVGQILLKPLEAAEGKKIVLLEEGVLTGEKVEELERKLEEEGWDVSVLYPRRSSVERLVEKMCGAGAVVCAGSEWHWNWLLPVGARVFSFGSDRGSEHMSEICELQHKNVREIGEVLAVPKESLPIIWVPRSDLKGYFAHAGDSFREMVRMWAARGLCEVREHPTAKQVWWGSVGPAGVLLYDRPTLEWLMAAPEEEQKWCLALFGNPAPKQREDLEGGPSQPWFFWPRRPELVEQCASKAKSEWKSRPANVVFYGKVENRVQKKRREAQEWREACSGEGSEWILVKGDELYPFTQKEYIERLGQAKFGLCLAGYGLKCHREVECMAMGCVPLVAAECDMDNYAEAPVEGVHYVRVASPEEARKVAEEISEETWTRMSEAGRTWWKRNASCEGSFTLTKNLCQG